MGPGIRGYWGSLSRVPLLPRDQHRLTDNESVLRAGEGDVKVGKQAREAGAGGLIYHHLVPAVTNTTQVNSTLHEARSTLKSGRHS